MESTKKKALHYAYPSSQAASELGFTTRGCWYITVNNVIYGASPGTEEGKARALKYFEEMPYEIDTMSSFGYKPY